MSSLQDPRAPAETVIRNIGASLVAAFGGLLSFGVPLLLLTGPLSDRWQHLALVPWGLIALYLFQREFRLRLSMAPGRVEVRNYVKSRTFSAGDLQAIVGTRSSYPNPLEVPGCAGFLPKGTTKPFPANVTMSCGWRFRRAELAGSSFPLHAGALGT
jgi:hypothetical protein